MNHIVCVTLLILLSSLFLQNREKEEKQSSFPPAGFRAAATFHLLYILCFGLTSPWSAWKTAEFGRIKTKRKDWETLTQWIKFLFSDYSLLRCGRCVSACSPRASAERLADNAGSETKLLLILENHHQRAGVAIKSHLLTVVWFRSTAQSEDSLGSTSS